MQYLLIILSFFIFTPAKANETVIELHENKSLDQIVLDKFNEDIEDSSNIEENVIEGSEDEIAIIENDSTVVLENVSVSDSEIKNDIFWSSITKENTINYLENLKDIKSEVIQNEINTFLENTNFNNSLTEDKNIFYFFIKYFYETGNLSKAYELSKSRSYEGDSNINYYKNIELNYLLSTYQLEDACLSRENFSEDTNLENYLLEKIDIFCLVLKDSVLEAELLNSILIETEKNIDQTFQELYKFIIGQKSNTEDKKIFENLEYPDLIFLYSAMARIGEVPLNESFLTVDSKNLAIPIILNKYSPIELRIKAANESYINNNISIESLAALYQSVDFNSTQLNEKEKTINLLSKNTEMLMVYYFRLINIQIFPSERLEALIDFWNFANVNGLEEIAYALSYNIVQSIDVSGENSDYATQIATAYIYNLDFVNALKWIEFYETAKDPDDKSYYTRILLSLYSADSINAVVDIINENYEKFTINQTSKINEELIFILLNILDIKADKYLKQNFDFIFDERTIPSQFIIENINNAINLEDEYKFLIYSAISLNNKNWKQIHPQHLKLILNGFLNYKDGKIIQNIILEIFKNYKII